MISNLKIRYAHPNDAAKIATILSNWIDDTDWMPRVHTREEDQTFGKFLIQKTQVRVAESEQKLVGFLALRDQNIEALYVDKQTRGSGIGSALIEDAKRISNSLSLWTFQANTGARRFYAGHGFLEAERSEGLTNDEKLPDVRFVWTKEAKT